MICLFKYSTMKKVFGKCDHEQNRAKVCAPCGEKIKRGTKKIEYFQITKKYLLKKNLLKNILLKINPWVNRNILQVYS